MLPPDATSTLFPVVKVDEVDDENRLDDWRDPSDFPEDDTMAAGNAAEAATNAPTEFAGSAPFGIRVKKGG